MDERGYLTLELTNNESINLNPAVLKYIPVLESEYNDGEETVPEDDDFELAPFNREGGLGKVHQVFGNELNKLIEELNEVIAA